MEDMTIARWTPLVALLAAASFVACGSFGSAELPSTTSPESGAADADGGSPESGPGDAGPDADAPSACRVDPDAGCDDGGCEPRCPVVGDFVGDLVRFEAEGTKQRLRMLTDCHRYDCVVNDDKDGDGGYDCASPGIGHVGRVCSSGLVNGTCALKALVNLGVNNEDNCNNDVCTYTCQRIE